MSYNHKDLINYKNIGYLSRMAVPTDEHFLPLVYVVGVQEKSDNIEVIHKSTQNSSISMSCIKIG